MGLCYGYLPRIRLSRSAPSPTHSLSSTSCGAHALICCRRHRPLEVSSHPPHTLSSTSCGAHVLICCHGHRPLEVSSLPHTLSHLVAVVLMRSSAVVGIVLSRSAPSPHTLSHLPAVGLMRPSAVEDIVLSWSAPSQTLSSTRSGALPSGVESSVSLALPRARE